MVSVSISVSNLHIPESQSQSQCRKLHIPESQSQTVWYRNFRYFLVGTHLKALQNGNKLEFQRSNFNITTMKKPIIQALIQAQSNFVSSLEDFVHKILYL